MALWPNFVNLQLHRWNTLKVKQGHYFVSIDSFLKSLAYLSSHNC